MARAAPPAAPASPTGAAPRTVARAPDLPRPRPAETEPEPRGAPLTHPRERDPVEALLRWWLLAYFLLGAVGGVVVAVADRSAG